jgi:hypothetical protein
VYPTIEWVRRVNGHAGPKLCRYSRTARRAIFGVFLFFFIKNKSGFFGNTSKNQLFHKKTEKQSRPRRLSALRT